MSSSNGQRASNATKRAADVEPQRWQRADKIKSHFVEWLLPERIVLGGLAVIEGETSSGKSTLMAHLVSAVTTGKPWLGRPKTEPGSVLWLTGEEDFGSMIRPRLKAAGADERRIHTPSIDENGEPVRYYLPGCVTYLRQAILDLRLSVIILEPLSSFVGAETDLNSVTSVRAALDPVQRMALATHCTVIVTRGLRKDRTGPRTSWGQGSAAIGDTARSILQIDCPDQNKTGRVLRMAKVYGARRPSDVAYDIVSSKEGPVMQCFRQLSSTESLEAESVADVGERSVRADARRMLRKMLSDGWVKSSIIMAAGADAGISPNTIRRAQAELNVVTRQTWDGSASYWEWGPPEGGFAPDATPSVKPEHLGKRPVKPRKKAYKSNEQIPRYPDTQPSPAPPPPV
jgi:hypothetical protein